MLQQSHRWGLIAGGGVYPRASSPPPTHTLNESLYYERLVCILVNIPYSLKFLRGKYFAFLAKYCSKTNFHGYFFFTVELPATPSIIDEPWDKFFVVLL